MKRPQVLEAIFFKSQIEKFFAWSWVVGRAPNTSAQRGFSDVGMLMPMGELLHGKTIYMLEVIFFKLQIKKLLNSLGWWEVSPTHRPGGGLAMLDAGARWGNGGWVEV